MDKLLLPTTVEDIDHIAPKLREADKQECLATTGQKPLGVLHTALLYGDNSPLSELVKSLPDFNDEDTDLSELTPH